MSCPKVVQRAPAMGSDGFFLWAAFESSPSLATLRERAAARKESLARQRQFDELKLRVLNALVACCLQCAATVTSPCEFCVDRCLGSSRAPPSDDTAAMEQKLTVREDMPPPPPSQLDISPQAITRLVAELRREAAAWRPPAASASLQRLEEEDPDYAKPLKGSQTEARARAAHDHIEKEVLQLLEVIEAHGARGVASDHEVLIRFGELFDVYSDISNKVVGVLVRARKYGLVYFRGEMLLQRRDDDQPVVLLKTAEEARATIFQDGRGEFASGSLAA